MFKRVIIVVSTLILGIVSANADEGMWLLNTLGKNIKQMHAAGLKLSSEEIYSANNSSLKDAIIIFGGGCTGEIVSSQGLIFTNHHCGYSAVQALSSVEHNWLKNGFWAKNKNEELPTNLKATFIRKIVDVTDMVNKSTYHDIIDMYSNPEKNITARIVPMFEGNQSILFVEEVFGDVRLVGVPPESIGKYGGDTDNWMWPRHTGDFSIFRVYASKDNKSTRGYDKDNVPYSPSYHLTVSTKGYKEGDYAMIMGFPGSTTRYMTTWEIDNMLNIENPIRIFVRGEKQNIWWNDMMADEAVRLKYSNKYATSSNYWKNSIGMSKGIKKLNVRDRMQEKQDAFTAWVNSDPERKKEYDKALQLIESGQKGENPIIRNIMLSMECLSGIETYKFTRTLNSALKDENKDLIKNSGDLFFKDYNISTDRKSTERMIEILVDSLDSTHRPDFTEKYKKNELKGLLDYLFSVSILTDSTRFRKALEKDDFGNELKNDTLFRLMSQFNYKPADDFFKYAKDLSEGRHLYVKGLMEMFGEKCMYPDANFTIRLTYGKVLPYKAADAVYYDYYTTLEGVIAKEDADNADFELDPKLKELFVKKDYGRWADKDGTMHVNFLSTNDITGGNSGSPVMNSKGELIGLAFDGNWEAMSGDVVFEPELQRTISLDVRYLLFIVDKFAGANNIIEELTLN